MCSLDEIMKVHLTTIDNWGVDCLQTVSLCEKHSLCGYLSHSRGYLVALSVEHTNGLSQFNRITGNQIRREILHKTDGIFMK